MSHDSWMWSTYFRVKKYAEDSLKYYDVHNQGLWLNGTYLMAKRVTRFRPRGVGFWAHFTPKGLGQAIKEGREQAYYLERLRDPKSAENPFNCDQSFEEWKERRGKKITDYELAALDALEKIMYEVNAQVGMEDV